MDKRLFEDDEQVYVLDRNKNIIDLGYILGYDIILKEYTVKTLGDIYVLKEEMLRNKGEVNNESTKQARARS